MKTSDIVIAYNEAAKKLDRNPVKKFKDRATAEKRLATILVELKTKPINLPFKGIQHKVRSNSLRKLLMNRMENGATLLELQEVIKQRDEKVGKDLGNLKIRVKRTLFFIHDYNGYGIRQEGTKLFLVKE